MTTSGTDLPHPLRYCRRARLARILRVAAASLLGAFALGHAPARAAGDPGAIVTIADGQASFVRQANRHPMAEGVRAQAQDLIHVGTAGFVRIEFADGTIADLGPDTQAMLMPRGVGARDAKPPLLYLLRGWVKLSAAPGRAASRPGFAAPAFDLLDTEGVAVATADAARGAVFAETGAGRARDKRATGPVIALKAGEFLDRPADGKPAIAPRPSPAFLASLPRPFHDTLPPRRGLFAQVQPALRPGVPVTYPEVEQWLVSEPALRRQFVARWQARARDPAFRAALAAGLRAHPEWEPVLYPERFKGPDGGNDRSPPASTGASAGKAQDKPGYSPTTPAPQPR